MLSWDEIEANKDFLKGLGELEFKYWECLFDFYDTDGDGEISFARITPYIKSTIIPNPDGKRWEGVIACTDECGSKASDYPDCYNLVNETAYDGECLCKQ